MILAAITTCKRKPEMLERALKSVVNQTYKDWNLLVVDDSPADYEFREDVRKMVERYSENDKRIRYYPHDKNYGAQRARNNALKIAEKEGFEFIAYLDDDDEWLPEKLEKQLSKFNECNKNTALVYCGQYFVILDSTGKISLQISKVKEGHVHSDLLIGNFIGSCSIPMVRTKVLQEVGGFDENFEARQDLETWLRVTEQYDVACINEPLIRYHKYHGDHIGSSLSRDIRSLKRLMLKHEASFKNEKNKYALWRRLLLLSKKLIQNREYKDAFKTWIQAVSLYPLRIISNLTTVLYAFLPFGFAARCKYGFRTRFPSLYKILKLIKEKLSGRM